MTNKRQNSTSTAYSGLVPTSDVSDVGETCDLVEIRTTEATEEEIESEEKKTFLILLIPISPGFRLRVRLRFLTFTRP